MSLHAVMRSRAAGLAKYLLAAGLICAALSQPARADVSFGFFYSNLGPHGDWRVSAQYGQVWQPTIYAAGWHPYYDGHWVYTDLGWAWVSDYAWGAIPYHYGTWVSDPYLGWVWVPGYVWAPSWVVFRTGPDYIGWCPVPAGYSIGASYSFGNLPAARFVFVGTGDFLAPRIRVHAMPASRTKVILTQTKIVNRITVRNDVVVNPGPDVRIVEKARGRRIEALPVERVERIAPARMVRREHLRVRPEARRAGLRAAEPRSVHATADRREAAHPKSARRGEIFPRREPTARNEPTVRREPNPRHEPTLRRESAPRREPTVSREPAARSQGPTGDRAVGKQPAPKRRPESQQGAKPEQKPKRKPDRKPPGS